MVTVQSQPRKQAYECKHSSRLTVKICLALNSYNVTIINSDDTIIFEFLRVDYIYR